MRRSNLSRKSLSPPTPFRAEKPMWKKLTLMVATTVAIVLLVSALGRGAVLILRGCYAFPSGAE